MFFNKKNPEKTICFFCNIEVEKNEAFVLEYKALDGTGKVDACPMCSGMLDDLMIKGKELYETD